MISQATSAELLVHLRQYDAQHMPRNITALQ